MELKAKKILIILGPTATGKSDFAVQVAKILNGEIISADSRQVYIGLDIGAGKITKEEMQGVPHYLLDIADPNSSERYTAKKWSEDAEKAILEITNRGKLPIICGGTGFYISTLLGEVRISDTPPDHKLREELNKKPVEEVVEIFKSLLSESGQSASSTNIDLNNKVKVIRAIEILNAGESLIEKNSELPEKKYEFVKIGLSLPDDILKQKIKNRLIKRLDSSHGDSRTMLDEAKSLLEAGLSTERMKELGLEYRYLGMHLNGEITYDEMVEMLEHKIWQYARRQKIWFKRFSDINWIDPSTTTPASICESILVKNLLS